MRRKIKKNIQFIFRVILCTLCFNLLIFILNQSPFSVVADENQNSTLDIDGDGEFDALTDGLLIIRSMFGLSGDALVTGVVGQDAQFLSPEDIEQRLALLGDKLDIDENGQIDALTDGLLSLRFLFGLSGTTLIDNVIASNANRSESNEIESYLSDLTRFNINFTSSNAFSVPENQKTVGIISATDVDGDALTYSVVSSTDNNLVINSITGELFFISAPDYEAKRSYRVVVSATDGENTTIKGIQIAVTNVDDVGAVFTSSPNFSVKENTSIVGTVIASDIDSSNLEFSVSGNELAIENSGLLTFIEAPDFEFRNEYKATITVTDGINPAYQNITITITDENDVAPTILSDSSFTPIVAPGKPTAVGNVDARDADSKSLTFSISGSELSIDSNGGITFKNEPAYGTEIIFDAIVSVTDGVFSVDQNILVDPLYDFDGDGSPDHIDPDDDNDGVFDDVDAFPLDSNESEDTDGDGVGNNQDTDDDNDGEPDVTDPFPLDPGNVFDSDGDGVVDREDVSPNDPTITKAIQFNLADSRSIGLGEALRDNSDSISSFFNNLSKKAKANLSKKNGNTQKVSLDSLTNIINWDADGDEIRDAIMSSETLFVAGANITPDGRFLYLLTSQHLQNRTQGLDNEICSIYRISIQDNSYSCLLNVSDGDIEPKVLVPSLQNDFSRRGISFRSDGAAVMQGFDSNRELPDGYEGGTNSTIAYFMSSDGKLTRLPAGEDFFVVGVAWLTDEFIAVAEYPMISGNGENPRAGEERLVIIDSVTLEPIKYVNAPNIWGPIVKANNNIYWSGGGALSGDTLEKIDSIFGGMGQPVADLDGVNFYTFLDSNDENNKLINVNGTPTFNLSDGIGTTYNPNKQSGTGSDIKYSAFAFDEDFVGFLKSYGPETPIISIENQEFQRDKTFSLSNGNGSLEVGSTKDLFYIRPSAEQSGDLVIDYVVSSDGLDQEKQLIITDSTISNWRNDENRGVDFLEWPSPEPDQEGFCVYQKSQSLERCNKFDDYKVLSMDLESNRGTRYDDEAVYPDGTGNAFPGIQTILFTGDDFRVYFKDTTNHTYYEASANTSDFIARGGEALKYVEADNGGGDLNIIAQGLSLKPLSPKPMTILLAETAPQEITIEFPETLSSFARLPRFEVWNGIQTIPLAEEIDWNSERTIAKVTTTVQGWTGGIQNHVRLLDFIFLPNSIQRYQPSTDLIFTSSNLNENTPEFESADNFSIPENQTIVGDVVASDADGDLVGYILSGPDQENLSIDVSTGTLSFNEAPDYETRSTYRITVTATDGVNSSDQDIFVMVTDVDDVAPVITSPASFIAPENQLNIGTVTATDIDSESVTFEISGENLQIDSSGLMTFIDAPDFETKSSYTGVVTATDGTNSSNQEIIIAITDENDPPVINSPAEFYAAENQTSIGAVIATDADGDLLTYSIQAEQGTNNNNAFIQDSDSTLDETDFYVVSPSSDQSVTLRIYDIDDQMKIILRNSSGVAQEELTYGKGSDTTINVLDYIAVDGSTIDLELTNTNAGYTMGWELSVEGEVVYSNSCGQYDVSGCAGDSYSSGVVYAATIQLGTLNDNISINSSTGQLTFDTAPDYETKNTYEITATVTDGLSKTGQYTLVLVTNVDDVAPVITSPASFSAPENQLIAGQVSATDVDSESISFSILGENLEINSDDGSISFIEAPDYETKSVYTAVVTASDGTNSSNMDISIEIIDIEDEDPPIFTSESTFTVEENQRQIGIVTVTDANSSDIAFSISGTDILISSDGMLSFAVEPDYETKTKYIATVTASDGTNDSTQEISVNIININDNSPVISSNNSFEALENQTSIGAVIATDADGDLLTYSIQAEQGTNNNNAFIQDSDSTLDETDFYVVSPSSDQSVTLRIYDIDDQMKIILRNSSGVAQEELTYGKGSDTTINVLDYIAVDGSTIDLELTNTNAGYTMGWELSVEGEVVYSNSCGQYDVSGCAGDSYSSGVVYAATIQLGTLNDNISINSSTGQLTFDTAPDYETKNTYEITATVTDGENTTNQNITINIIDAVDEQPPVFTSDPDFEIYENTVDIGTVVVADNSDSLTFSVLDKNFLLSDSGELKFLSAPDYESKSTYTLDVFVNDGTYTVKQNVTVSVRNVLEDVISETFDISDGTNTEPPKLVANIQLDELNMAKNVYLSLTSFDSQGEDEFCSLGFIYQVFELEKQEGNTWSIQQDLRQDLSENCTYGASYYITEDNIVAESTPPQDGIHLRISDTELLTDTRQFAMRYSASQNVTFKNARSSSDQPAFLLYKYDQNYPESCVISESSVSEIWGTAATWDAACFNSLAEVSEIDENFMSINFSILSSLPVESSFSVLAAPKAVLDSSYDEYRAETNEIQVNRGVESAENYPSAGSISNGSQYVVDLSAKVHKTTPNTALYLRSYMFAHNSNFARQPFLLYSRLGDFLDESQTYDTTPPVLNSLTISDYTITEKPDRDFKKFTVQLDNLTIGDEEKSPIRDIWINTVDPSCRSVKFEIRDEADGLLDASQSEYSATIPFLKQHLGTYQITQIAVNDHALNTSLYGQKAESTHPSIGTIFNVGSTPIISCPHFNNYASDLIINVSVGDTFVGDFVATASEGDDVIYKLERSPNSDFDIDLLSVSETGQVSFVQSVAQDTLGGKFRVTASSSSNPDLTRKITVEISVVIE